MTFKTEGIIIKRINFKEADLILKILTPDLGKIDVIAKGARRIKSKMAGSLELFYINNFMLAEGKTFNVLCSAQTIERHLFLRESLEKLGKAFYIAEIIDKFIPEGEKNKKAYLELCLALLGLKDNHDLATQLFEIKMLKHLGYGPELISCIVCSKDLKPDEGNYLDVSLGGAVCPICSRSHDNCFLVSDSALKFLRLMQSQESNIVCRVNNANGLLSELDNFGQGYIECLLGKSLKSKKFIGKIA
jgi:DNA repair protein RecO (recombination protein O)